MKNDDGAVGCLIFGWLALFAWTLWPSSDQVCRLHKVPVWDSITGTASQPTCQELIDATDANARDALAKVENLEGRVSDLEQKLGE